jgi:hypothetical protein
MEGSMPKVVTTVLDTLVLFPPDDTASNLEPKNATVAGFPQSVMEAYVWAPSSIIA